MKMKTEIQPCFFLTVISDNKIVQAYHAKYNAINEMLNKNCEILDCMHEDLQRYGSENGRSSVFSTEQVLRMLIVKTVEGLSFRNLIIRVSESDFLRNFTMIGMGKVMSCGFLDGAFKSIRPETWHKVNDQLFKYALENEKISSSHLRIDSTVCESNIKYPTDWGLLWDTYRVLSRFVRRATSFDRALDCGFRFHDRKMKKLYTFICTHSTRKGKSVRRKVHKNLRILIERTENATNKAQMFITNAESIESCISAEKTVCQLKKMLPVMQKVTEQARKVWLEGKTISASERVFSIFETHTELHKRGKARKPIEFGHLVTLGQTKEKFITYYSVEEKSRHDTEHKDLALDRHKECFGRYPDVFAADKNYHVSLDDTSQWEKKVSTFGIAKKGRRSREEIEREHSPAFRSAQKFRAGCEGSISVLKRVFGLERCFFRGFKSFASSIACLVFSHNLVQLASG